MRVGILGAGGIAQSMAKTLNGLSDVENYGVASRSLEKAQGFADKWGTKRAYGSYEDMLSDDDIDLVYIALPHNYHCEWTKAALNAGKNVLCEKPFAVSENEARQMIDLAESKKLLLTEAIWTRYMPSRKMIDDLINKGSIGEIKTVSANLGYRIDMNERMVRPELAGGALLDLTVYTLNFASMVLGDSIKKISASCVFHETGVDGQDSVMIEYNNGKMASLFTTMYALTDRRGLICGREGFITVENINNPWKITVYAPDREKYEIKEELMVPEQITGYEYQVLACKRAIENGDIECEEMPHAETIEIMRQMDEIRRQFGIVYPFEK